MNNDKNLPHAVLELKHEMRRLFEREVEDRDFEAQRDNFDAELDEIRHRYFGE